MIYSSYVCYINQTTENLKYSSFFGFSNEVLQISLVTIKSLVSTKTKVTRKEVKYLK